jgi:hypothetical protein
MELNLTSNEIELLKEFAYCQYTSTNGAPEYAKVPSDLATYVFLDERSVNNLNIRQMKGVLSSLVQKNLVTVWSEKGEHDSLNFTQLGFDTVMELIKK